MKEVDQLLKDSNKFLTTVEDFFDSVEKAKALNTLGRSNPQRKKEISQGLSNFSRRRMEFIRKHGSDLINKLQDEVKPIVINGRTYSLDVKDLLWSYFTDENSVCWNCVENK